MATTESYTGDDCTGNDGGTNRTLTLDNDIITLDNGLAVHVDGYFLHPTSDFTIDHNSQNSIITFLNAIFDSQKITVSYVTSGTAEGTSGESGVLPFDSQLWNNEIDYSGETVTITVVVDDSYSDYGDATESTSNTTNVKAMVNDLTAEEIKQTEGILTGGDKIFFFKGNQGNITDGNRVVHDSVTYEIVRVLKRQTAGITFVQEAWGKKT
jgi:hypothetical protein